MSETETVDLTILVKIPKHLLPDDGARDHLARVASDAALERVLDALTGDET